MSQEDDKLNRLKQSVSEWEGWDPELTHAENFIEIKLQMGLLDEAQDYIKRIKKDFN